MNTKKMRLYAVVHDRNSIEPITVECEKITELFDDGKVEIAGRAGSAFTPVIILPASSGRKFKENLRQLRQHRKEEIDAVNKRHRDLYSKIVPW